MRSKCKAKCTSSHFRRWHFCPSPTSEHLFHLILDVVKIVFSPCVPVWDEMDTESWRLRLYKSSAGFSSPLPPRCVWNYTYERRPRVTSAHKLWVFLRIPTSVADTGTPSFQTVRTTVVTAALRRRKRRLNVPLRAVSGLPAGLWARVGVACTVGLRSRQRCAEIVGVGFIIDGAEDQARLVP